MSMYGKNHYNKKKRKKEKKVTQNILKKKKQQNKNCGRCYCLKTPDVTALQGLRPTEAWLGFQDAVTALVWVREEPPDNRGEIRQKKPYPRRVWRRHLRSPYSLLPNLQ